MKPEQIDTSTTAGKAEVMRLAAEGRDVAEARLVHGPINSFYSKWSGTSFPTWDWQNFKYAIIAEPVGPDEVWLTMYSDGLPIASHLEQPGWAPRNSRGEVATAVRYRRVEE